jgi:hypothetical protein
MVTSFFLSFAFVLDLGDLGTRVMAIGAHRPEMARHPAQRPGAHPTETPSNGLRFRHATHLILGVIGGPFGLIELDSIIDAFQ